MGTAESRLDHIAETKKLVNEIIRQRANQYHRLFHGDMDILTLEEREVCVSYCDEALDEFYAGETAAAKKDQDKEATIENRAFIRDNQTYPVIAGRF